MCNIGQKGGSPNIAYITFHISQNAVLLTLALDDVICTSSS